ncbi:hypothetical protein Ancab_005093 [Ancistrocladus abbreviatus]
MQNKKLGLYAILGLPDSRVSQDIIIAFAARDMRDIKDYTRESTKAQFLVVLAWFVLADHRAKTEYDQRYQAYKVSSHQHSSLKIYWFNIQRRRRYHYLNIIVTFMVEIRSLTLRLKSTNLNAQLIECLELQRGACKIGIREPDLYAILGLPNSQVSQDIIIASVARDMKDIKDCIRGSAKAQYLIGLAWSVLVDLRARTEYDQCHQAYKVSSHQHAAMLSSLFTRYFSLCQVQVLAWPCPF